VIAGPYHDGDGPRGADEPRPSASGHPASQGRGGAGLMVLAACGFLGLSILYMESALLPGATGVIVADLAFIIPLLLCTVLCIVACRRSRGVEARFWRIAAALNVVLLVSELYWVWWIATEGAPPPAIYAPFQALAAVAAFLGLALLATLVRMADAPAPIRMRWWLDLAAVATVAYVGSLEFFVHPLLAGHPDLDAGSHMIAAVYTAFGLMMIGGALWVLMRPGLMRWRLWERLIAASIVIYGAGMVLWPVWLAAFRNDAAVQERSVLNLVLVLGHYLFFLAVAARLVHRDHAWPMRRLGPARSVTGRVATYLALGVSVVSLPVLVAAAVLAPEASSDRVVLIVAAMVIAMLAVGRTIVSAVENGRLFRTSVSDPLTGLHNHSFFHERLAADLDAASRFGEPLAVIWVDIDDFGRFNRLAGHAAGDDLLRAVAEALRAACAERGVACRVGGDEFAVIARGADVSAASSIAERLDEELRASVKEGATPPTVSGGIARHPEDGGDSVVLAGKAEQMAAWARLHGKGRVLAYDDELAGGPASDDGLRAFEERTSLGTVRALAVAVDARLETAGTRSAVVAALSAALARQLGLDDERVRLIEIAALVHDVGMVALSDDLLGKTAPLTAPEIEAVRRHPSLGEQIVGACAPAAVVPWIRHHHERWDGAGYPDGLRAVAIPLEARIIAVCDAWDAMISERPYRRAMTAAEAVAELRACAGTQFDPELVEPLVRLVEAFHRI
jgi:diguanylate cyclase (GGDEF)-like protein